MNIRLAQDVSRHVEAAFPALDALWHVEENRMMFDGLVELFACEASDFISVTNGVYSTEDYHGELADVLKNTASWAALARVMADLPKIADAARMATPITLYNHEYKYLRVFEMTPGGGPYNSTILRHETLGEYNLCDQHRTYLRQLDDWLASLII